MKNDGRLTMAHLDMEGSALAKNGGDHVELHPGLDLWMRGARYGTTVKISADGIATVRMDHPQVKKLQRIPVGRLKLTTNRNPKTRRSKKASPAQIANRKRFAAMARARSKNRRPKTRRVKRNPIREGFQVAALRKGKILFLSGIGLTSNREAASLFKNMAAARKVAQQVRTVGGKFGISKVAIASAHDHINALRRYLLGEA